MKKISLLIMAAGLGSRFKGGIKQLEPVGANGELLMDYSIDNAIKAGFNEVVFIIRHDIEKDFMAKIGKRISQKIAIKIVYQELNKVPAAYQDANRTKPFGTTHAVLMAKDVINNPFVVINADDYYDLDAFQKMYAFLINNKDDQCYCLAGYKLGNTLSKVGAVNRGVCVTKDHYLTALTETHNIMLKTKELISDEGKPLTLNTVVSMNSWGFMPSIFTYLEQDFLSFLESNKNDNTKECILPDSISHLITTKMVQVKVLETTSKWFGMTYYEDVEEAKKHIAALQAK